MVVIVVVVVVVAVVVVTHSENGILLAKVIWELLYLRMRQRRWPCEWKRFLESHSRH